MKIENVEITKNELKPYLTDNEEDNLNTKVQALLSHQLSSPEGFPTLINNMKSYQMSRYGYVKIDGITLRVFYNPTRKKNVEASTFTNEHKNFSCFLCDLMPGQRGIKYSDGNYMLIVNPGITIPGDLTIPTVRHELQKLDGHFETMLKLSRDLSDYSIYFNGPMAGATCPHFHFQAGLRDRLPGERSINNLLQNKPEGYSSKEIIHSDEEGEIFRINNFLRTAYGCYSSSEEYMTDFAKNFMMQLKILDEKYIRELPNIPNFGAFIKVFQEPETEARFNVMTKYYPEKEKFLTVFFPKIYNRPQSYFAPGKEHLILGFAIKEALGHILTVNQDDLYKLLDKKHLLKQAYADTSLTPEMDRELFEKLKKLILDSLD